jgi:hypothetical protein
MMRLDAATDLEPVNDRHRIVDDSYVGLELYSHGNGAPAVGRFTANDPVGSRFNDRTNSGSYDFMVVRNQYLLHSAVPIAWNHW